MLSWNEIRHRSIAFSRENRDTISEKSESQTFWNEFFHIFGIKRRTVASFEEPVRKLSGTWGKIDLFWPSRVLIEHKSAGPDLDKAHAQGMEYIRGLMACADEPSHGIRCRAFSGFRVYSPRPGNVLSHDEVQGCGVDRRDSPSRDASRIPCSRNYPE